MIKPIKVTPINTSRNLYYKCSKCNTEGTIYLENSVVNVDDNGNPLDLLEYDCPKCGEKLNNGTKK